MLLKRLFRIMSLGDQVLWVLSIKTPHSRGILSLVPDKKENQHTLWLPPQNPALEMPQKETGLREQDGEQDEWFPATGRGR